MQQNRVVIRFNRNSNMQYIRKMRYFLLLIITFCFSLQTKAQQVDSTMVDSTYALGEVTVTGARVFNKIDRKLLIPTATQVANSSNGYDLLRHMSIPGLRVSATENTIISLRGGGVQVRINGVKATTQDIIALRPDEVIRVEDIDNPGVRYSDDNLDFVINYIVKRRYAGYVGGLSTTQAFTAGFNNSNAYFKYNYKKSEFSVDYGFSYREYDHKRSDSQSTYIFPDGTTRQRDYIGYDTPFMYTTNNVQLGYNLSEPDKYNLNVRLTYDGNNSPTGGDNQLAQETGQSDLYLYNKVRVLQQKPSLDAYYSLNMKHDRKLEVNVVGTYIDTDQDYLMKEYLYNTSPEQSMTADPIYNYSYGTAGSSNSLIAEAIYTQTLKKIALSAGAEYTYSHTNNKYTGSVSENDVMNYNNFYAFAQAQGTLKPITYSLGLGMNYVSTRQGGAGYDKWTFRPQLNLSTNITKNISLRYTGSISPQVPALSQLSNVRQQSNDLEANDGNSGLKPAFRYSNRLTASWNTSWLNLELTGAWAYMSGAIMNTIAPYEQADGSMILVTTPMNQKSFANGYVSAFGTAHIIKDVLDVSFWGGYDHYRSHGQDYLHRYDTWNGGATANLTLGKWNATYTFATAEKRMFGETISAGENQSTLWLQYKWRDFKFGLAGLLLGYAQGFDYTSETRNKYYRSNGDSYFKDNGNMVMFTVSYNFSHGRKYNNSDRSLNNSYGDSGVR